jgi:MFS transporter, OPA family, glycerol-3-phosphate transporter
LSLGTGSSIIATLGWEYVFLIPGVVLFVMASAIACWVKNTPNESTKVRFVVGARGVAINNAAKEQDGLSKSEQMRQLLRNYTFLGYLAAVFFLSWSRDGFLNWFYSFFDAVRAAPLTSADTAVIGGAWTIGGFVGGLLCGWLSDVLFRSDRVMPICIFSVFQAIVLGVLYYYSATCSVAMLGVLVFCCSVFLLGNYTLLSYTVPSDLPQDIAAGASGIMTCVAYFSTGLSGAVMGHLIDSGGYSLWILSLMAASILAGMCTALGSYFSPAKSGMMIDETELSAALEAMDEFTPLSSRSHSKRRASIVRLSADFIASPMPDPRSARSARHSFDP